MNEYIKKIAEDGLLWFPEKQVGYYPVDNTHYDDEYFKEYVRMENTEIGKCLNEFRLKWVNSYTSGLVLDIGIGCGTFIKKRGNCLGFDICPKAQSFLIKKDLFFNPFNSFNGKGAWAKIKGITFFDTLEHLSWPERVINKITNQFVFVTIPIFRDLEHLMRSKHLKRTEHFLYFTEHSLIEYMDNYGLKLLERRDDEIRCGREDILSFVFRRKV